VLALPVALYMVCAWIAQRVVAVGALPAEPVAAQLCIVAGVLVMAAVPLLPDLAVLVAGGMLAGFGQGVAYRSGLAIVSASSGPGQHARAASRYAAVAYLMAAVATLGLGVVASAADMTVSVLTAAVVLAVIAAATQVCRIRYSRIPVTAVRNSEFA